MPGLEMNTEVNLAHLFNMALTETNSTLPEEEQLIFSENLVLAGKDASIESLTLINLTLEFERILKSELGRAPNLFDMLSVEEPEQLTISSFLTLVEAALS